MADNVSITAGSGTTVAADELTDGTLGTVKVQYVKLMDGTLDSSNKLVINSAGQLSVLNPDQTATGSLTSTTSVTLTSLGGLSTAAVQITGTWSGTVQFEGSIDGGTTWNLVNAQVPTTGALVTSSTANGNWAVDVGGCSGFRVRCTIFTSGTIVVTVRGSIGESLTALDAPLPTGANVIGAVTQSGTWNIGSITTMPTTAVTGTFWQTTQPVSIATAPVLVAGSALIGKVGIDQTTVGTTNAVSLSQIGSTTVVTGGVNGTLAVGGVTAAAATATGNPVRVGSLAKTANPTAVTDGQVVSSMADKLGRQVVVLGHIRDMCGSQATTITSSTTATTIVTNVASTFCDITGIEMGNGSGSPTTLTVSDGTASYVYNLGAGQTIVKTFIPPRKATTVNVAWTATCGTSVASVYINVDYVKNL
jgi:hypothetical protein